MLQRDTARLARLHIPQTSCPIITCSNYRLPVWAECNCKDDARVAKWQAKRRCSSRVPQPGRVVETTRDECLTVGAKPHSADKILMRHWPGAGFAGLQVPKAGRIVL